MKAKTLFHRKYEWKERYVIEMALHEVYDLEKYPDGVKYGLIFIDVLNGSKVLMDNHHPKGHHIHLNDKELDYEFLSTSELVSDFKKIVFDHFGETI